MPDWRLPSHLEQLATAVGNGTADMADVTDALNGAAAEMRRLRQGMDAVKLAMKQVQQKRRRFFQRMDEAEVERDALRAIVDTPDDPNP